MTVLEQEYKLYMEEMHRTRSRKIYRVNGNTLEKFCSSCKKYLAVNEDNFVSSPEANQDNFRPMNVCRSCSGGEESRYSPDIEKRIEEYYLREGKDIIRYGKNRNLLIKEIVLDHYGKVCAECGLGYDEFLTVDHKNNDGAEDRKLMRLESPDKRQWEWVIANNFPDDIQILCMSCNVKKGIIFRKSIATSRLRSERVKNKIFDHYGKICVCCGESDLYKLNIHHVNQDGAEHRRKIAGIGRSSVNFYDWLIRNNFPNDPPLETQCANCNCSLEWHGYCPHQVEKTGIFSYRISNRERYL